MTFRIAIEKVPGFTATREFFTVRAKNQISAISAAEARCRELGSIAEIVNVRRVGTRAEQRRLNRTLYGV